MNRRQLGRNHGQPVQEQRDLGSCILGIPQQHDFDVVDNNNNVMLSLLTTTAGLLQATTKSGCRIGYDHLSLAVTLNVGECRMSVNSTMGRLPLFVCRVHDTETSVDDILCHAARTQ